MQSHHQLSLYLVKALLVLAVLFAILGCQNLGYSNMTAEQIRATAGTTTCTQYVGLYGKASSIALNQDDTRKGATSKGKTSIVCGEASMIIDSDIGVPIPRDATIIIQPPKAEGAR